jgi:hypothetical protein
MGAQSRIFTSIVPHHPPLHSTQANATFAGLQEAQSRAATIYPNLADLINKSLIINFTRMDATGLQKFGSMSMLMFVTYTSWWGGRMKALLPAKADNMKIPFSAGSCIFVRENQCRIRDPRKSPVHGTLPRKDLCESLARKKK